MKLIDMKRINNQLYLMLIAVFMLSSCSMSKMMFLEDESKYEFNKTVEELKSIMEKNGWDVTRKTDMKEHYAQYGFETRNMVTFEICKPEGAVAILNEDDFTRMLPFMPMRVAVYTKSDGKTYISRFKLKMMGKCNSDVVKEVMIGGSIDLEKAVFELI
jgi:uncharacterized protein (DUF302 family)